MFYFLNMPTIEKKSKLLHIYIFFHTLLKAIVDSNTCEEPRTVPTSVCPARVPYATVIIQKETVHFIWARGPLDWLFTDLQTFITDILRHYHK